MSSTIQDKFGECLTEEKEILSRWTEYCSELYNYERCGDNAILEKQGMSSTIQDKLRECLTEEKRDPQQMDRILLRTVQL